MRHFAVSLKIVIAAVAVFLLAFSDVAAEISITNSTAKPLAYRIRFPGKNWSKPYNIDPSQTHNFPTKQKLEVQTENGGEQRSWTLEAENNYEYAIKNNEAKADFHLSTERVASPVLPTIADKPRLDFPSREFTIKVIADQTYRDRYSEWKERILEVFTNASQYYEKYFNIRLTVLDIQPWEFSASSSNSEEMTEDLYKVDPGEIDLVVGIVGVTFSIDQSTQRLRLGSTINFGQHVHVSDSRGKGDAVRVIVHEIGHVLGAFHVKDRRSIMYPDSSQLATIFQFGKTVNEVFEQTQSLDLRCGAESLAPESALAIDEDRWIRKYAWLESPTHQHKTIPVAQRASNRWGLYDMYGNVAEWCSDWFSDVPNKEETDPTGPESGVSRVIRGGSSNLTKSLVDGPPNSSTRGELRPDEKSPEVGFRVVLHVE